MFKKFNIGEFKKENFKQIHTWKNTKFYLLEMYSKKESQSKNIDCNLRHDVMSYGDGNCLGKFITNVDTIRFLALNEDQNKIYRINKKIGQDDRIIEVSQYYETVCFVENKTQFYKMFFDFDYKYEKYPEIYNGYEGQQDVITQYILDKIKETLEQTLNLTRKSVEYIWAGKKNSHGHHIYFPNIITDKSLHFYIYSKSIEKIFQDKKYPKQLINQIFDDCVSKANGLRLFYFKCNGDYYYPIQEKSTLKFDPEPYKHFNLCFINTDFVTYNFDLKIKQDIITQSTQTINSKKKTKDLESGKEVNDLDYITDFKILDLDDKKELFIGLTNIIDIKRIDCYSDWIKLIYLHKNYGLKDEIISLSQKSPKYDSKAQQIISDIFSDKKTIRDQITIGSLIRWAKEDNIEKTNELLSKHHLSLKLDIQSIDEILLSRTNFKPEFIENCKYISDQATNIFLEKIKEKIDVLVLMSPTGTGKTTVINKIINKYVESNPNAKILSVITRRSMSACHITAFNNSESKIKFTSYLDDKYESIDYFISSLENLVRVDELYDFIILDEINSLINYFYSSTLQNKRLQCISILLKLILCSNMVIAVDANITDLVFTLFSQLNKKIFFYRNTFKNKKDVPLNIYYSQNYNEDNNLITYCEKFIIDQYIKKGKSCLILTDSKEVTDKLKLIFIQHNAREEYYRIFTREEGTLEDMKNINNVGKHKLILSSPKFVYGIDLLIPYEEVFMIYRRTSGLMSMGALEMIQQIGRARNTKTVNLLALDPNANFTENKYISFEQNKKMQESIINGYSKYHDELCKKYEVINLMGCTSLDLEGDVKFLPDSFMTQIHYLKTWYDQLFYRNKIDIIKLVAKDYGYKINDIEWNPEIKISNSLKSSLKLKKDEIIGIAKKICLNKENEIEPKYRYYIENIKEQVKIREKYLSGIEDIDLYLDLSSNHELFINWLNKKYLDMEKEQFEKKVIEINNNEFKQIINTDEIISKINSCFWLEDLLKIKRYQIEDIVCDDIDGIKKLLNKNIDKLFDIFKNNESKEKTIKSIEYKIKSIKNNNYLQKFIVECYNNIIEDIFIINKKKIYLSRYETITEYSIKIKN